MSGKHRAERPSGYWERIDAELAEAPPIDAEQARDLRALLAGFAARAAEDEALAEVRQR